MLEAEVARARDAHHWRAGTNHLPHFGIDTGHHAVGVGHEVRVEGRDLDVAAGGDELVKRRGGVAPERVLEEHVAGHGVELVRLDGGEELVKVLLGGGDGGNIVLQVLEPARVIHGVAAAGGGRGADGIPGGSAAVRGIPDLIRHGEDHTRGGLIHRAGELLAQAAGARFNLVPMSTSAQALQAVVNGDSQLSVDGIAPLLPLVKAGRLRALGVTSSRVLPGLEGLPLAKDAVPGVEASGWFMLFANKGTPPARLQALNAAVSAALQSPEVVQKLQATANYPVGGSVADARAFLAREKAKWAGAVQRAGLTPE